MQIYICDDDELDTARLRRMIENYAQRFGCAPIIKAFSSPGELLAVLKSGKVKPDFLFLDIYMGGMDGIQVLEQLRALYEYSVPVVFTTASEDHAVDAFRLRAMGYLHKPYTQQDFDHAMKRVENLFAQSGRALELWEPELESRQSVYLKDIFYLESAGRGTLLHIGGESSRTGVCARLRTAKGMTGPVCTVRSRIPMQTYREKLADARDFCECGRSYLVNLSHAVELTDNSLQLEDEEVIYVPERQRALILQRLENWRQYDRDLHM